MTDALNNKRKKLVDTYSSSKKTRNSENKDEIVIDIENMNSEEDEVPLLTINKINSNFENFVKLYDSVKTEVKIIVNNYENVFNRIKKQKDEIENNQQKLIIALFGERGHGKSTLINYLFTGKRDGLLPESSIAAQGCTKVPVRCRFWSKDVYKIEVIYEDKIETTEVIADENALKNKIKDYMSSSYQEITINLPVSVLPQTHLFMKNIVLLDLLGMPEDKLDAISLNRRAIEREKIDAVFIVSRIRGECTVDTVRHMWEIGVFSNLKEMKPPKLVVVEPVEECNLFDDTRIKEILIGFSKHNPRKSIISSLRHTEAFDLPEDPENFQTSPASCETKRLALDIENKTTVIPEICSRCDELFLRFIKKDELFVLNDTDETYDSLRNLEEVIQDIKTHKDDFNLRNIMVTVAGLTTELIVKVKSKKNSCRKNQNVNIYTEISKFLHDNKTYKNRINLTKANIKNNLKKILKCCISKEVALEDFITFDGDSNPVFPRSIQRIQNRANELYNDTVEFVSKNLMDVIDFIKDQIKKMVENKKITLERRNEVNSIGNEFSVEYFARELDDVDSKYSIITLKRGIFDYLRNSINDGEFKNIFKECQKNILCMVTEVKEDIMISTNPTIDTLDASVNLESKLKELNKKIEQFLRLENRLTDTVEIESDPINPIRFIGEKNLSLRLPSNEGNDTVFAIEDCFRNRWLKSENSAKSECAKILFEEGRTKSQIIPECRDISENLKTELTLLGIQAAIQVKIDRIEKKIYFEFDDTNINNRIHKLIKEISNSDKSVDKNGALYPIFISSVKRSLRCADINDTFTPNLLIGPLKNGTTPDKFLIFLFIEAGVPSHREEFQEDIDFYIELIKEADSNGSSINPIIPVFLPERNLGIGRKRKLMMLLAETFKLNRFYLIDDDIDEFFEYDRRSHVRRPREHGLSAYRGLRYMSTLLDYSIDDKDEIAAVSISIPEDIIIKWIRALSRLNISPDKQESYDELFQIVFKNKLYERRDYVIRLLDKLENSVPTEFVEEIKSKLFGSKNKIIGQIGMWNQNQYRISKTMLDRLTGQNITTHYISKLRYQVVLYNLEAIKGIHPISDEVLFEPPLDKSEKAHLSHSVMGESFDNPDACKAARLGYKFSDQAHVYYQILNGVSGFLLYYYSFKDMKNLASKVDSDETFSNLE